MRLIVGLGNPGRSYAATRHNVGVMAMEQAAVRWNIPLREVASARRGRGTYNQVDLTLAQPLAWMNLTGPIVRDLLTELGLPPHDLLVIHDDLDLPLGCLRIKRSGGSGGHNGIRSIQAALASEDFPRLKIGIGRPAPGEETADYVLAPFHHDERGTVRHAVDQAVRALESYLSDGLDHAMNQFNRREQEGAN